MSKKIHVVDAILRGVVLKIGQGDYRLYILTNINKTHVNIEKIGGNVIIKN